MVENEQEKRDCKRSFYVEKVNNLVFYPPSKLARNSPIAFLSKICELWRRMLLAVAYCTAPLSCTIVHRSVVRYYILIAHYIAV